MGADVIIAVFLDTGPVDPKDMNSFLGLAGRSISIMISANEMRSIQMADILISPDLKGYDASDFNKSAEIVPKGVEAARRKQGVLSMLRASDADWQALRATQQARRRTEVPIPKFVEVSGTGAAGDRTIQSALKPSLNKPIDTARLDTKLRELNGEGIFNSLSYGLVKHGDDAGLLIRSTEKSYGPPFLNLGLFIDGSDPNDVRFGLGARLTVMNVAGYGSEWRTDLNFGNTYGAATEFMRPFAEGSNWFAAPRLYASRGRFDVYSDKTRVAQYSTNRAGGGFDLGYRIGRFAELRVGEDASLVAGTLKVGAPIAPNGSRTITNSSVRFQYLGQNDVVLPTKGLLRNARFDWFSTGSSKGSYMTYREQTDFFQPIGSRGSLILGASGGSAFGAHNLGLQSFSLGGPFHLGAYGVNELLGDQYFLLQGGYSHRLMNLSPLVGESVYAVGLYEVGKTYGYPHNGALPMDGTVALVAKTALGPVFIGGSASGSRVRWWFGIGRIF